ncbi:hypothetical protein GGX14DRAFT_403481 [Mycena pura]|uniref:Uncharacterized protein n=1 Tax=Mycena pura TaxID=153505 RepID=A0AAD6Y8I1_9AGAR|nr:hypothetical protein GGX14DRAFT_403481 [Mycena pura]
MAATGSRALVHGEGTVRGDMSAKASEKNQMAVSGRTPSARKFLCSAGSYGVSELGDAGDMRERGGDGGATDVIGSRGYSWMVRVHRLSSQQIVLRMARHGKGRWGAESIEGPLGAARGEIRGVETNGPSAEKVSQEAGARRSGGVGARRQQRQWLSLVARRAKKSAGPKPREVQTGWGVDLQTMEAVRNPARSQSGGLLVRGRGGHADTGGGDQQPREIIPLQGGEELVVKVVTSTYATCTGGPSRTYVGVRISDVLEEDVEALDTPRTRGRQNETTSERKRSRIVTHKTYAPRVQEISSRSTPSQSHSAFRRTAASTRRKGQMNKEGPTLTGSAHPAPAESHTSPACYVSRLSRARVRVPRRNRRA